MRVSGGSALIAPLLESTGEQTQATPRMPQLDALRGFAVLAVMYQHFAPDQLWLRYLPLARLGVQLFFVLSGFLITGILLVARERVSCGESRTFELRQFFARRFLRIFPLYYAVVIGAALIGIQGFSGPLLWHLTYLTNVYNAMTGQWAGASAHLWTLSVEEQFYLVWPWIILLTPRRWLTVVITMIVAFGPLFRSALVILGWSQMALYTLTPSSLDAFGCGALLALARQRAINRGDGRLRRRLTRWGLAIGAPLAALTFWSLLWPGQWFWLFNIGGNSALSLAFVWLIDRAATGFAGSVGRLLE
jgi:peptidoglycan/LPS O-acetylase OafA/YrhL